MGQTIRDRQLKVLEQCDAANRKQAKRITYVYRGTVAVREGDRWARGYSQDGDNAAHWMTQSECLAHASSQGCVAQFYTPPGKGADIFDPEVQS
jgi:hypothetical protein